MFLSYIRFQGEHENQNDINLMSYWLNYDENFVSLYEVTNNKEILFF